jgi:hypothetical protein
LYRAQQQRSVDAMLAALEYHIEYHVGVDQKFQHALSVTRLIYLGPYFVSR